MKFTLLATLLSTAAAFAPVKSGARTSALQMGYENEFGVIAPTGFFDPLGLSTNIDQETFDAYRASELKVGCIVNYRGNAFRMSHNLMLSLARTCLPALRPWIHRA